MRRLIAATLRRQGTGDLDSEDHELTSRESRVEVSGEDVAQEELETGPAHSKGSHERKKPIVVLKQIIRRPSSVRRRSQRSSSKGSQGYREIAQQLLQEDDDETEFEGVRSSRRLSSQSNQDMIATESRLDAVFGNSLQREEAGHSKMLRRSRARCTSSRRNLQSAKFVSLPSDHEPPRLLQTAGLLQLINFHDRMREVAGEDSFDKYLDYLAQARTQGELRKNVYLLLRNQVELLEDFEACLGNPSPSYRGHSPKGSFSHSSGEDHFSGDDLGASLSLLQYNTASAMEGLEQLAHVGGISTPLSSVLTPGMGLGSDTGSQTDREAEDQFPDGDDFDDDLSQGRARGTRYTMRTQMTYMSQCAEDVMELEDLLAEFREALVDEVDAYADMLDILDDLQTGRISRELCLQAIEERLEGVHDEMLSEVTPLVDAVLRHQVEVLEELSVYEDTDDVPPPPPPP